MTIDKAFRDEEGFTTAGMAVALLVSLSLLFSAAQIYRVESLSAEVQEVADAAALAAENQVAEFMIAVRVADAVTFSLTLVGDLAYGLGVVALCVPPAAEVGTQLVSTGHKILQARTKFSQQAVRALNQIQRALPFLAAANAAAVAMANGKGRSCSYLALGVLLPATGVPMESVPNKAEEAMEEAVTDRQDDLAEAASAAEEAAREANEAKARGFASDCGNNPGHCLYERAAHLASLSASDNPLYASPDSWSFSVALQRARAYYPVRLQNERPASDSVEEQARSALRKRFYAYAVRALRSGYVHETADSFKAYFPRLPRNTEQMRSTDLYTEPVYPVTADGELPVMHAWEGCPEAGAVDSYASVQTLERGSFASCAACQFSASSLGNVASASTSIDNGFEYHYAAIARAAEDYEKARAKSGPAAQAAKNEARDLLDQIRAALKEAGAARIHATPPGAKGCIAIVVSPEELDAGPFEGVFVSGHGLGARAAVAASTLIEDESDEASVVGDLLDGLVNQGVPLAGAGTLVLECWSAVLSFYGKGTDGLIGGIEGALNNLPLIGAAGLGSWAADGLRNVMRETGLQPAKVEPLKPVLASSAGVARAAGGEYADRFLKLRDIVLADPSAGSDGLSLLGTGLGREAYDALAGRQIEFARIEIPVLGMEIPLTITLPDSIAEGASGLVERALGALSSVIPSEEGVKRWQ